MNERVYFISWHSLLYILTFRLCFNMGKMFAMSLEAEIGELKVQVQAGAANE